jgi:myosin-crossreactive antigen
MTRFADKAEQPAAQRRSAEEASKTYLVGGGIASMAAAAFLIRDDDVIGRDITILEESDVIGGSLDGSGTPETGYVIRDGRMFREQIRLHLRTVFLDTGADRKPDRHAGDFRLE